MTMAMPAAPDVAWSPQLGPQAIAMSGRGVIDELFFGGARGGGKTDFLLGDFASDLWQGANWRGVIFRKTHPELDEVVSRSLQIYPATGGEWKAGVREWHWPNGASLKMRHLENEADVANYQGHQYSWIGWDELPNLINLKPYKAMIATLRGPAQHKRIRATGNPGGPSHAEVKRYFGIDKYPDGYTPLYSGKSKMTRCFIPSRVQDNQILLATDPGYVDRLQGLGDSVMIRAWLGGDWDVSLGGFYQCGREQLLCDPFEIPPNWRLFVALDYGEHHETAGGLFAVDFDDDLWFVNSYYSSGAGAEHAAGIKNMIEGCPWTQQKSPRGRNPNQILAPADMWTKRSPGEATLARSPADTFQEHGLHLQRANMDRINGWRNLGHLIEHKRIHFFKGYTEPLVDSILQVQRSARNPEDVEKGGNDHGADMVRYGVNHSFKPRKSAQKPDGDGQSILDKLVNDGEKRPRYGER